MATTNATPAAMPADSPPPQLFETVLADVVTEDGPVSHVLLRFDERQLDSLRDYVVEGLNSAEEAVRTQERVVALYRAERCPAPGIQQLLLHQCQERVSGFRNALAQLDDALGLFR